MQQDYPKRHVNDHDVCSVFVQDVCVLCSLNWCSTYPLTPIGSGGRNRTTLAVDYFPSDDTECPGGKCPISKVPHKSCPWLTWKVLHDANFHIVCDRAIEDSFEARAAEMKQEMEQEAYDEDVSYWAIQEAGKPPTEKPFSAPEMRPLTGAGYFVTLPKNSTPASSFWNEHSCASRAVEAATQLSHPDCVRCQGEDGVAARLPYYITDKISELYCPQCAWQEEAKEARLSQYCPDCAWEEEDAKEAGRG